MSKLGRSIDSCARARVCGLAPTLALCSRSAHTGLIRYLNYGRCSLRGRSWVSMGAGPCREKRASTVGSLIFR